jgi:hypothetical protein
LKELCDRCRQEIIIVRARDVRKCAEEIAAANKEDYRNRRKKNAN